MQLSKHILNLHILRLYWKVRKEDNMIIKTKEQLDGIRESGKINTEILDIVSEQIKVGMSTDDINRIVDENTRRLGGIPAPLGYEGYPKSVCTSINDQVCHGIPSSDILIQDGDIINVDVTTIYRSYYADASRMFMLGNVSEERRKLVDVAYECIKVGLKEVLPGKPIGDLGYAIHRYVKGQGFSVVAEVGGHGVGVSFHEDPFVCYVSKKGTGVTLVPGMVFTIEPMINMGKRHVVLDRNEWTIWTRDGSDSAQWEVTVAVTENGFEVLAW